ncbi:MAG: thioredoxin [Candidatus Pelagibacter sp.]|nr:thioredoxin [Candidatus Pelagibacter sp.]OUV96412.1 MAG: thioredoxin [Candidatus Pelagibacter sp. TMED142]|tara:strand:- start:345 stop:668 length:324 start_codon:yes stop_codon:yes gene_type:complete
MATVEITDDNFENTVLKADKFFLLDFWAPWCAPCKMISPVLEELSNEMSNRLTIGKINIDSELQTGTKYGVRGIPFLLLFHNGEVIDQKVGAANKSSIKEWLESKLK